MEQAFKEIIGGLVSFPFLPMTALFFAEVTFGLLYLNRLRRHAIWLLSVASLRVASIAGLFLLEFLSRQFHWSGGDPGLEGTLIILLLFVIWVILSLISVSIFSFITVQRIRRDVKRPANQRFQFMAGMRATLGMNSAIRPH